MLFLFIIPILAGLGNYAVPLMIGAADMAFPRINALSFWMLPVGGALMFSGYFFGGTAQAGWTNYVPITTRAYSPQSGQDLWIVGLIGFLPFVSTFLGIWSNLLRRRNPGSTPSTARELQSEAVGIFALLSFRSIFSDEFIWHPPLLFFLVLGYAELLRRGRPESVHALQPLADAWGEIGGVPAGLNRPRGDPGPGP